MDEFEFYFSFYGLLLGLSVAEVASGFLNALGSRRSVSIGFLTPALAIFIFIDISSFWLVAWSMRQSLAVGWGTMFMGLLVALSYYFAAGLVFPRQISEWPELDNHYWQHKRLVIAGVLVANIIVFAQTLTIRTPSWSWEFWITQVTYWPVLVALVVSRNKKLDVALLVIAIVSYLALAFHPMDTLAMGNG